MQRDQIYQAQTLKCLVFANLVSISNVNLKIYTQNFSLLSNVSGPLIKSQMLFLRHHPKLQQVKTNQKKIKESSKTDFHANKTKMGYSQCEYQKSEKNIMNKSVQFDHNKNLPSKSNVTQSSFPHHPSTKSQHNRHDFQQKPSRLPKYQSFGSRNSKVKIYPSKSQSVLSSHFKKTNHKFKSQFVTFFNRIALKPSSKEKLLDWKHCQPAGQKYVKQVRKSNSKEILESALKKGQQRVSHQISISVQDTIRKQNVHSQKHIPLTMEQRSQPSSITMEQNGPTTLDRKKLMSLAVSNKYIESLVATTRKEKTYLTNRQDS